MRPIEATALKTKGVLAEHGGMRAARLADLPRLTAIYNQAVPERSATADTKIRSAEERRSWFDDYPWAEGCPLLVLEEQGSVVGYAGAALFRPGKQGYEGCLEVTLYVDSSARGRGLGRRLLAALIDAAKALNNRVLVSLVFADNSHSNGLFAHHGFSLCGNLTDAILFPEPGAKPRDVCLWMLSL
jgi:L-amino acid N-acyltransferase YncA